MANRNNCDLKNKKETDYLLGNNQYWENLNLLTNSNIRILLFKECRLRDRELLFDSYREQKDENGLPKEEKNKAEEFSYLTELIFGSTAMKYHDTYFKIHDVSSPDRLILTQVFSTPLVKKFSGRKSSFNTSNSNLSNSSVLESSNSFSSYVYDPSINSKSNSFSLIRNPHWISPNSTSTTLDSGFSESSFSRNSSLSQSFGGLSARRSSTSSSLDTFGSFLSESDSARNFRTNVSYSKLGLALIVPKPAVNKNEENIYLNHIPLIESILWRLRQYVEIALNSPRLFLSTMLEISLLSAKWLSNELNLWIKPASKKQGNCYQNFAVSIRNSLNKLTFPRNLFFKRRTSEDGFENFCHVLEKLETKENKFFMSTLLTAVLTHHTGWIGTCHPLEEISLEDSYHAVWNQLTNLFGATGYLTKTSKTVIYGLKEDDLVKTVLGFLLYFMRYFRVQRRYVERSSVEEENIIINEILNRCKNVDETESKIAGLSRTKTSNLCLSLLTDLDEEITEVQSNNSGIQNSHIDKPTDLVTINADGGLKRSGLSKSKACGNDLFKLSALAEETSPGSDEIEENSVLFILGDNEKLEHLKKFEENKKAQTVISKNKVDTEYEASTKLNVIKFPLPKEKVVGELTDVLPTSFLPDLNTLDELVPDKIVQGLNIPISKWERILTNGLLLKKSCLFADRIEENVTILGDVDNCNVQVLSSVRKRMAKKEMDGEVDPSPIVAAMLDTVLQMWKQNMSKEQCTTFLEQKLVEICLKANALSQFLLTTDFCTMDTLVKTLKINLVDVPLLMAVGSHINPKVLQKYGLSYQ